MMTVYALSYAVLSPLLVAFTGRWGRRRVLFWGMTIFAVAAALSALSPGQGTLLLSRALAAVGAGIMTPIAAAVIAALSPENRRGKTLAAVFFGLTLAQVVGVPMGAWLGYEIGWRYAFGVVAVLALPCLWLIWVRVPRGLRFQPVSLADLGGVLRDRRMMMAVSFTAVFLSGIYILYTYLAPLLSREMGFGSTQIMLMLAIFGMGAVVGNLFGGWLTDRFGPDRTLTGLALMQFLLMPLFGLLPFPSILVFALGLTWAIFGWSFNAAQQARLVSRDPERAPVSLALNAAAIYFGAAIGSGIGGVVLAQIGYLGLGPVAGVLTGLSILTIRLAR
ncbi:MAG: MFS transporter [Marinovum sp.]|nr:MFS transporter [Marinovum sp.]